MRQRYKRYDYWYGNSLRDLSPAGQREIIAVAGRFKPKDGRYREVDIQFRKRSWDTDFVVRVSDFIITTDDDYRFDQSHLPYGIDTKGRLVVLMTIEFGEKLAEPLTRMRYRPDPTSPIVTWSGNTHRIALVYPSNYPGSFPVPYPLDFNAARLKHSGMSGAMCVMDPRDGRSRSWDTASDDNGVTMIGFAIQWLRSYEYYNRTGDWPGETSH